MTQKRPDEPWKFEMYIIGGNQRSTLAVENLRDICKKYLDSHCQITVVDLKKYPEKMAENKICVTPTLIRTYPAPPRTLIGDLSKTEVVLRGLDLNRKGRNGDRDVYSKGLSRQGVPSKHNRLPH